eukprot:COSAG02_NODE_2114_length_9799_cov_54.257423_1_plen_759_part_00
MQHQPLSGNAGAAFVPFDPWANVGDPISTLEAVTNLHSDDARSASVSAVHHNVEPVPSPADQLSQSVSADEECCPSSLPEWSTALKGENVSVASPTRAEITANAFKVSTAIMSCQPLASIIEPGSKLYFEVTITGPGKEKGDVLHSGTLVGLIAHTRIAGSRMHSTRGVWGLRAACDHNALRLNGRPGGAVVGNSNGYSFGCGERVGMLVDRDKCTVQISRDGVPLEGALLQLKLRDFSFETFRLVVDLAGFVGTTATLSVPEKLPAFVASASTIDKLQGKITALEAALSTTNRNDERTMGSHAPHLAEVKLKEDHEKPRWLIGGKDDLTRAAPAWSLVHTAYHALLEAKQQALLHGKPMLRPNGHATLFWNITIDRAQPARSLLQACGKASRKNLLCGGTIVKFSGESGVDQGGLTRELFTLFRQELLVPSSSDDVQLFCGFVGESVCGEGAASVEERAFVPRANAGSDEDLKNFKNLGRALMVVFRQQYTLDHRFAGYILTYLCADDAFPLADRAAIGTTGEATATDCTDEETLMEVESALTVVATLDPVLAENLRRVVETPLGGEMSAEDLFGEGSTEAILDTRSGRARAVCACLHLRLISSRRKQLEAMKEGFLHAADLRPALQLFAPRELEALLLRQIWINPVAVLDSLRFEDWEDTSDTTPLHFRKLIERWGSQPATRDGELRRLIVWATGSDELPEGATIRVKPASSALHLPSAATCTMEILLPPLGASSCAQELEEQLATAVGHSTFGVE